MFASVIVDIAADEGCVGDDNRSGDGQDDSDPSKCGYCGSPNGPSSLSYGIWAYQLSVHDYQDLIDRGWRRSGKYIYRPDMRLTCCPAYTIRLDSTKYKMSKGNKKVVRKVRRWCADGVGRVNKKIDSNVVGGDGGSAKKRKQDLEEVEGDGGDDEMDDDEDEGAPMQEMLMKPSKPVPDATTESINDCAIDGDVEGHSNNGNGVAMNAVESSATTVTTTTTTTKGWVKQPKKQKNQPADLATAISQAEKKGPNGHRLTVKLVPAKFEQETYDLYVRYQSIIHKEPPSRTTPQGFKNFLVESPLTFIPPPSTTPTFPGYGSFHQKYYMDDILIAVAVIDILPRCVSSVYLMYDPIPAVMQLSIGVYSAIREVMFTLELSKLVPELRYYYMGFYIHSCPKMRYKAQFKPSDLACPETYEWVPVDKCIPLLDQHKVARLSSALHSEEANTGTKTVLGPDALSKRERSLVKNSVAESMFAFFGQRITFLKNIPGYRDHLEEVKGFIALVGEDLARRFIIVTG
ncbi:Arginyl-tRNA--protein transferase 1 [Blyttiomyces sp. JEL0837]|nr:Arginyl-tRNA--protein transferase 1 [Blyttiomyces sp. JEL0837]